MLTIGLGIVGFLVLLSLAARLVAPVGPEVGDPTIILAAPSWDHPAGTDQLGRDMLARIVWGGRASLSVAFGIVLLSVGGGLILGASSALAGRWIDHAIMRIVDVLISVPGMVIALAFSAAMGPSLRNLVLVLGLLGIPFFTRLFRGEALSISERPFVLAARVSGAGFARILFLHLLPNLAPVVATFASTALSGALLAASALSFIGLGAQPPTPEWGALIFEGRNTIMYEWWCAILPGMAVTLAALGFVFVGDGLRDWLDPRAARQ